MMKFSQKILRVVAAFILFTTAISIPLAPAHADTVECVMNKIAVLDPGQSCVLKDAEKKASISVNFSLMVPSVRGQKASMKRLPVAESDCNKEVTLNNSMTQKTLICTVPNTTTSITATNDQTTADPLNDVAVKVFWNSNEFKSIK